MRRFLSRFGLVCLVVGLAAAPVVAQTNKSNADFAAEARKVCTTMFTAKDANELVNPKFFIDACMADSTATGTFTFVDEMKIAYFKANDQAARAVSEDPKTAGYLKKVGTKGAAAKPLPKAATPEFQAKARKACAKAMKIPEANAILNPKIAIEECVEDALLTGGFDFVEAAKNRYLVAIHRLGRSLDKEAALRDPKAKYVSKFSAEVQRALDSMGSGKSTGCKNNCAGHGACSPAGCLCNSGWTGVDCTTATKQ